MELFKIISTYAYRNIHQPQFLWYEERTRYFIYDVALLLSDREGHGHKAVLYKSHFPPLRHSVDRETPLYT